MSRIAKPKPVKLNVSVDDIINDLSLGKPMGPDSRVVIPGEYSTHTVHTKRDYFTRKIWVSKIKNFGYTDEQIFNLQIHSRDAAYMYFGSKHPKIVASRRANMLWSRIEKAIVRFKSVGSSGIYGVTAHAAEWCSPMVYIQADSTEEAKKSSILYFGHILGPKCSAKYVSPGNFEDIVKLNTAIKQTSGNSIKELQKEIKEKEEEITKLTNIISAAETIVSLQMAAENDS